MDKYIGQLKEAEIQDSMPKGDYYAFLFSIITRIIIFWLRLFHCYFMELTITITIMYYYSNNIIYLKKNRIGYLLLLDSSYSCIDFF